MSERKQSGGCPSRSPTDETSDAGPPWQHGPGVGKLPRRSASSYGSVDGPLDHSLRATTAESIEIRSSLDGYRLAATLHQPRGRPPRVCLIVNSGAAIPRRFYHEFAQWLAASDVACVTYDYRGMFDSRLPTGEGYEVTARSWGERDLAGVIDWCGQFFPALPLMCVAHSIGGHILGFADNAVKLDRIVLVSCGSVYWGYRETFPSKLVRAGFWYVMLPFFAAAFGKFPGRALRIVGDIPRDVALQWAKWCRHPGYVRGAEPGASGFDTIRAPILSVHFDDDEEIPPKAIEAFAGCFTRSIVAIRRFRCNEVPAGAIGHFNFFKASVGQPLWRDVVIWLTQEDMDGPRSGPMCSCELVARSD